MKVIILAIVMILALVSCETRVSTVDSSQANSIKNSLSYFKDTATGLCFAAITTGAVDRVADAGVSITCVPCDSLTRVSVK